LPGPRQFQPLKIAKDFEFGQLLLARRRAYHDYEHIRMTIKQGVSQGPRFGTKESLQKPQMHADGRGWKSMSLPSVFICVHLRSILPPVSSERRRRSRERFAVRCRSGPHRLRNEEANLMHAATTDVFCRENSRHKYRKRKSKAHKHDALASPPEQGNYVAKNVILRHKSGRQNAPRNRVTQE
jgi:hypothetical protein